MNFWIWVLTLCVIAMVAANTTPVGTVSVDNISLRDDATTVQMLALRASLIVLDQRIDDYGVFKVATIGGSDDPLVMVGMPFTGKYYRHGY